MDKKKDPRKTKIQMSPKSLQHMAKMEFGDEYHGNTESVWSSKIPSLVLIQKPYDSLHFKFLPGCRKRAPFSEHCIMGFSKPVPRVLSTFKSKMAASAMFESRLLLDLEARDILESVQTSFEEEHNYPK